MKSEQEVDVCIIGSGAGGGVTAYALSQAGLSVVVLEAGPRFDPTQYPLNENVWEQHPHAFPVSKKDRDKHRYTSSERQPLDPRFTHLRSWSERKGFSNNSGQRKAPHVSRVKGVGGTTLHYQGEAHRFSPHGFRSQSLFGYGEDWPLTYQDLAPYYQQIENLLGVAGDHLNPWKAPREPFPHPPHRLSCASQRVKRGFDQLGLHLHPNSLAILSQPQDDRPPCNYCNGCTFGCMMKSKSSMDVSLLPQAEATGLVKILTNVTAHHITLNPKGAVKGVLYFDDQKTEHFQKAKVVVVSAGALESARLLLNSQSSTFPEGMANHSGLVGRNFMETISHISTGLFSEPLHSYKGLQIDSRAWDLNEPRKGLPFQGGMVFGVSALDLLGPVSYARSVAPGWGKDHKDFMRAHFGNGINVFAIGEQHPHPDNRVTLDSEVVDYYGIPVAKISTRLSEHDLQMLSFMAKQCRGILKAAGAERIIREKNAYDQSMITHMSGTCRMGNTPQSSVLNQFCQSHDVRNLFVIDSSCFVTEGGGDSPSLTIQALALRASEYLIQEAKLGNLA